MRVFKPGDEVYFVPSTIVGETFKGVVRSVKDHGIEPWHSYSYCIDCPEYVSFDKLHVPDHTAYMGEERTFATESEAWSFIQGDWDGEQIYWDKHHPGSNEEEDV